jgi:predicted O-methyltransferase YrrM
MTDLNRLLDEYVLQHSEPEDDVLKQLTRETNLKTIHPRMLSGPMQGTLLQMFSYMIRPRRVLEIGTFTGYGTICLAKGLAEDGHVHTIEINDEIIEIPLKYFEACNLTDKITLHCGHASAIIPSLDDDFDLVLIDGEKTEYIDYYNCVFEKVKQGGFILADNVLWSGKVLEETKRGDESTAALKKFNQMVSEDTRVEKVLLPIRDGLTVIRKK